ncbi:tryptophan--tRNA ligase [Rubrivirga sp. S365]|uniref:Tryptophan--tRNA ligase n=1 Tax=Rubrivirga litoralis TaxID=3075598 RepID=A0ABU3BRI8_9BACT|nr:MULTISPECIES: tryptophan--tRNA ligase [unclassified Rubrivirga]MDT0631901.1 tryptophan--tRNA ligase [Rubrivirga sp. F394]MDT7857954.1 tryptophan--tRNA ligase [Rubrivirga sp. S365]
MPAPRPAPPATDAAHAAPPVLVSGIQPSGTLHVGNYLGALRQNIALANDPARRSEAFLFVADYHALTTLRAPEALRRNTLDAALDYLALGLDPDRTHLFVQSDVPQLGELTWVFLCLTPTSLLEKGVAYKDKTAQGASANAGLLTYPILQAADILAYAAPGRGLIVPVGADQKQNLEISRDTAARFNQTFGTGGAASEGGADDGTEPGRGGLFPLPEPLILDDVAVVPGLDGRKMSKSYGNTIGIFDEGAALKKKVMSIVTDSTPLEEPKDPDADNVFALIRLFADEAKQAEVAAAYRAGGYGYGHAKKELLALVTDYFGEARERRRALAERPDDVRDVLAAGGAAARARAAEVLGEVREAVGFLNAGTGYEVRGTA